MNPPQTIIFVNRFYWPDEPATSQLLTDLAQSLAAAGHTIKVITSQPVEPPLPANEEHNGVLIHRVPGPRFRHRSVLLKAFSYLSFGRKARHMLKSMLKPGDVLVVMTDPPLFGASASLLAHKRGAHIVHWVQDIYPEIAIAVANSWFARLFRSKRDRAWKRASACVVPGSDMADLVRSRCANPSKVIVSPNWAPNGLEPMTASDADGLRREWNLAGKFVVMYSGNLGRVHDLDPVLELAGQMIKDTDIVFVFVGDGAQRPRLEATAKRLGLHNVLFKPPQARRHLGVTLALADIHLVTLRAGCEQLVFPSKLYGIAAVGRPVLYFGPKQCELARTIEARGFGRTYVRTETSAAAQTILHLRHAPADCTRMGKCALAFTQLNGGLATAVATWEQLLTNLNPPAPSNTP